MTVARKPREKSDVDLAAMRLAVEAGPAEIYVSNSATTTVGVRRDGLETHEEDQVLIQGMAAAVQEVRQGPGREGVQPAAGRSEGALVDSPCPGAPLWRRPAVDAFCLPASRFESSGEVLTVTAGRR